MQDHQRIHARARHQAIKPSSPPSSHQPKENNELTMSGHGWTKKRQRAAQTGWHRHGCRRRHTRLRQHRNQSQYWWYLHSLRHPQGPKSVCAKNTKSTQQKKKSQCLKRERESVWRVARGAWCVALATIHGQGSRAPCLLPHIVRFNCGSVGAAHL